MAYLAGLLSDLVPEDLRRGLRWHAHVLEGLPESAVLRGLVRYEPPAAATPDATKKAPARRATRPGPG